MQLANGKVELFRSSSCNSLQDLSNSTPVRTVVLCGFLTSSWGLLCHSYYGKPDQLTNLRNISTAAQGHQQQQRLLLPVEKAHQLVDRPGGVVERGLPQVLSRCHSKLVCQNKENAKMLGYHVARQRPQLGQTLEIIEHNLLPALCPTLSRYFMIFHCPRSSINK